MGYITDRELTEWQTGKHSSVVTSSDVIERAIEVSSNAIDEYCFRTFTEASGTATERKFAAYSSFAMIDDCVEITAASVDYAETSPLNAAALGVPIVGIEGSGFPELVTVTADWGWAAVPPEVKQATLIKTSRLLKRRESPNGLDGISEFGVVRVSQYEDPDVVLLLTPLRRADRVLGMA